MRIFANVYDVGTCGIVVLLVASDQGHVLLDVGPADAAPLVAANIRSARLRARATSQWIVTSHEHHDHVGGVAALQRLTGAKVAASAAAQAPARDRRASTPRIRRRGLPTRSPASVSTGCMRDGEELTLGSAAA